MVACARPLDIGRATALARDKCASVPTSSVADAAKLAANPFGGDWREGVQKVLRRQPQPPGRQRYTGPERPAAGRSPDDDQNRVDQQVGAEVGLEVMPALNLGDRSHLLPVELSVGLLCRHGSVVAESDGARPC